MRVIFFLLMMITSAAQGMDTVGQENHLERDILEGNQQVWALALSEKTEMPLEHAELLLDFYRDHKSPDEYAALIKLIGTKKSSRHNELLQALIVAQSDHTQMLAQQIAQTKELADRSSISTQKALSVAKQRLYVALAAGGLGLISVTMNILQATNVIE